MNRVIFSLGSNIGNRKNNLKHAVSHLSANDCHLVRESSVYETEPWGVTNQNSYYNQVIETKTSFSAGEVMELILQIEMKMGRVRIEKWEPRIIDIDILFYNSEIIQSPDIMVPHPHLHERKFVLVPLAEIIPEHEHPVLHKTVAELLSVLKDESLVKKVDV